MIATNTDTKKTRCRWKRVCTNCGKDDPKSDKTNKCSIELNSANCGEGHMAMINDCEMEQKERIIKKCKLMAEWEDQQLFKS